MNPCKLISDKYYDDDVILARFDHAYLTFRFIL